MYLMLNKVWDPKPAAETLRSGVVSNVAAHACMARNTTRSEA